ncbi:WXG100 family type VII secretion target [Nocardia mangyaensis]|uniref:WXG100 family type VII secretion target n=1 Tax=Nocardia mangyaensis TaxID=2213200 RepID=UPI0026753D3D|nr:WXG100 family type VII secretion target [Nocardia mangyaensis]MDO3651340.1 WXG100 family type VII secretion target [Nocardia mangyaensis]
MAGESDTPGTVFAMVPGEVTDAGVYVQQVAESLINGLGTLDREVSTVLDSWSGAAAEAFGDGWTETKKGAADVLNALTAMGELLGIASNAIANQDLSNSHALSLFHPAAAV